jgi:hypothetical protein
MFRLCALYLEGVKRGATDSVARVGMKMDVADQEADTRRSTCDVKLKAKRSGLSSIGWYGVFNTDTCEAFLKFFQVKRFSLCPVPRREAVLCQLLSSRSKERKRYKAQPIQKRSTSF